MRLALIEFLISYFEHCGDVSVGKTLVLVTAIIKKIFLITKEAVVFVVRYDTQVCHVLVHLLHVGNHFHIDDSFVEFGLSQHFLQHFVFFSQHPDQFVHVAFVHHCFVLNLLRSLRIP